MNDQGSALLSSLMTMGRAFSNVFVLPFHRHQREKWPQLLAKGMLDRQNHILVKHMALEPGA